MQKYKIVILAILMVISTAAAQTVDYKINSPDKFINPQYISDKSLKTAANFKENSVNKFIILDLAGSKNITEIELTFKTKLSIKDFKKKYGKAYVGLSDSFYNFKKNKKYIKNYKISKKQHFITLKYSYKNKIGNYIKIDFANIDLNDLAIANIEVFYVESSNENRLAVKDVSIKINRQNALFAIELSSSAEIVVLYDTNFNYYFNRKLTKSYIPVRKAKKHLFLLNNLRKKTTYAYKIIIKENGKKVGEYFDKFTTK